MHPGADADGRPPGPGGNLAALGGQTLAGSGFGLCGRFTQRLPWRKIHELYQLPAHTPALNLRPRYNGCPTQDFASLRLDGCARRIATLRWGLVPSWAKDPKTGSRLINARAETVHERPAFRGAFRRRRCLVPADGWFEWRREGSGKQPYFIAAAGGAPVSFAGLWERWEKGDEPLETFTVLTTTAAPALADIHHRQPSIIPTVDFDEWLDPDTAEDRLLALARRSTEGPFDCWAVSKRVNSPRNDDPDLLRPLDAETGR